MAISFVPCRFKERASSNQVPVVKSDDADPLLPCGELTGDTRSVSTVVTPVPLPGCFAQRKAGLCPRGLGDPVDRALQLNGLAK